MTDPTYDRQPGNEPHSHPMAEPVHEDKPQGVYDAPEVTSSETAHVEPAFSTQPDVPMTTQTTTTYTASTEVTAPTQSEAPLAKVPEGLPLGKIGGFAAAAAGALALFAGYRRLKGREASQGIHVHDAVTIERPAEELYEFWHNFENLPQFMKHLEAVTVLSPTQSRWKAKAPGGLSVEWDAEITQDERARLIAWRSLPNADVPNSGSVRFAPAPGNRGTEVHVELEYNPPAGKLGQMFAKLFREEPEQQIAGDLRRFKQLMEAGELPTTEGQPHGERSTTGKVAEALFKQKEG